MTRTTIRSPGAMAIAALFIAGTAFVLFADLIAGAPITPAHALTFLALVAATVSGHSFWNELRQFRFLTGIGLAVLFVVALSYIVIASGARNGEAAAVKTAEITDRADKRKAAAQRLADAETELASAKAYTIKLRDDAATECSPARGGAGPKCNGATSLRDAAERVEGLRRTDVATLREKLDKLAPVGEVNAGYAYAGRVFEALGLGKAAAIAARLALVMPYLSVLITELGTIVFLAMALGHKTVAQKPANENAPPQPTPPADRAPVASTLPSNVIEHPVLTALRQAGRPLSNQELADAMRVSEGEASKRRQEVARHVVTQRQGRHLMVGIR